jgi:hypothetical protein
MHDLYRQSRLKSIREERLKEMEIIAGTKDIHHLAHLQPSLSIQRKVSKVELTPSKPSQRKSMLRGAEVMEEEEEQEEQS